MSLNSILSLRQFSAVIQTKEAILRSIFAQYDFPYEAASSIIHLLTATELLLKEESKRHGTKASELIKTRDRWDESQRELARWINEQRNSVLHQGLFPPEDQTIVLAKLRAGISLVGDLWNDQKVHLEEHFSPFERALLNGLEPDWESETEAISIAAVSYCAFNGRMAVKMANAAFEIAVRGLGQGWEIQNARELPLQELQTVMEELEDEMAHPSLFNDWMRTDYSFQEFGGDGIEWFSPPMTAEGIIESSNGAWNELRAAMNYTQLIHDVVLSYAERVPYWGFEVCLRRNWKKIEAHVRAIRPELEIPQVDFEDWENTHSFPGDFLRIPFREDDFRSRMPLSGHFEAEALLIFKEVIELHCDELPADLRL